MVGSEAPGQAEIIKIKKYINKKKNSIELFEQSTRLIRF
jgi:hypothetical protein